MAVRVRLNPAGIAAVMKSAEMVAGVHSVAEQIAATVRAEGVMVEHVPGDISLPVEVEDTVGETARSSVTIAHPSGQAVQAKHGALTAAAAAAGLEVGGGG